jgi:hypothetical protein
MGKKRRREPFCVAGQYGTHINDQWRIRFTWKDAASHDVEVVDYEKEQQSENNGMRPVPTGETFSTRSF